jgi:hypothetical protein
VGTQFRPRDRVPVAFEAADAHENEGRAADGEVGGCEAGSQLFHLVQRRCEPRVSASVGVNEPVLVDGEEYRIQPERDLYCD